MKPQHEIVVDITKDDLPRDEQKSSTTRGEAAAFSSFEAAASRRPPETALAGYDCPPAAAMLKLSLAAHSASARWRVPYRAESTKQSEVVWAGVAQLVEHLICNQRVGGSNPFVSSSFPIARSEVVDC